MPDKPASQAEPQAPSEKPVAGAAKEATATVPPAPVEGNQTRRDLADDEPAVEEEASDERLAAAPPPETAPAVRSTPPKKEEGDVASPTPGGGAGDGETAREVAPAAETDRTFALEPVPAAKTAERTAPATGGSAKAAAAPKADDSTFRFEPADTGTTAAKDGDTPKAPARLGRPYVQAGLFGVPENATRLIERLKARGIPAVSRTLVSGGKSFSRVLAGPFEDRAARDAAQKVIRDMGMRDAVPVRG